MPRKTADIIAIMLAGVVAVVVVATACVILWLQLSDPNEDTTAAADAIGRIVGVLVAALVGYMAGRQIDSPDIEP